MAKDAIELHESLAPGWEARYSRPSFRARERVVTELLGGLDLTSRTWLDAGCGSGRFTRWLAGRGATAIGTDAASEMLRIARDASNAIGLVRLDTVESLPFAASSCDGILCLSVLEYVGRVDATLGEFRRVLRPGGMLLVSVPDSRSLIRRAFRLVAPLLALAGSRRLEWLSFSRNAYTEPDFARSLDSAGFDVRRSLRSGGSFPPGLQARDRFGTLLYFLAIKR